MILINPAFPDVTEAWFDPEYWGAQARPVEAGGRGSAWFIAAGKNGLVLRQYRRGGLVSKVSESRYLFTGGNRVRSITEFELLKELYDLDFPVPQPVAAWYERKGLFYQAAIIVERIPEAVTFGSVWRELPDKAWAEIGRVIRQFHDAGVFHADLNCFNILLRSQSVYLIDFDKARFVSGAKNTSSAKWKGQNLERLKRSIHKTQPFNEKASLEQTWARLIAAYDHS